MKTAAFISDDALYVVSKNEDNEQNIFNIGGSIVFGRNCNQTIVDLFKRFGNKKVSTKRLVNFAQKAIKSGELYICSKEFNVIKIDKNGFSEIKNARTKDITCQTVPYSSLVDYVNDFLLEDEDEPQFGFICKKSAKTLYGEDTKLFLISNEYSQNGRFDDKRNQKNNATYKKLLSHLESIVSLTENRQETNIHRQKQAKAVGNKIKYETYKVINEYLIPHRIKSVFVGKSGFSDQELSDLVDGDFEHLIVSLHKNQIQNECDTRDIKNDKAQNLSNIYSAKTKTFRYANSIILTVDKREAENIKKEIESSAIVYEVRKPHIVRIPRPIISPIDIKSTSKLDMWNLDMIGAYDAWLKTKGNGVKVGIIDTGVDYKHENLEGQFDTKNPGFDFINNNKKPLDLNGHGTHVAGTVAGINTGVAPETSLYALRVLDKNGCGSEIDVILALEWAIDYNLDIVNMSIGFEYNSRPLGEACKAAVSNGILICAAAGNAPYEICFPGDYRFPGVVSFSAVDRNCERPYWSKISDNNDLSAPGVNVVSSIPGGSYASMSGTSMATPHGAGSAALVMSYVREDPESIEEIMKQSAEQIGDRSDYGFGLVRPDLVLMAERKKELALALR